MAVTQWVIDNQKTINQVRKRIFRVLMTDATSYRTAEAHTEDLVSNPYTVVDAMDIEELWAAGTVISIESFLAGSERNLEDYYYNIMASLELARLNPSITLDGLVAAGQAAIDLYPTKAASFGAWVTLVGLADPQTTEEKRSLVLGMMLFADTGIIAGGIKR